MKLKKLNLLIAVFMAIIMLTACGQEAVEEDAGKADGENLAANKSPDPDTVGEEDFDLESADFDEIVEAARGTTVRFYGWGGDEVRNRFLEGEVADIMQEKYDINLEIVGMDIDSILAKLSGEKQAGTEEGSIDMIWINGENFYSCKENDMLYGPFTHKLPAFNQYIDQEDPETLSDFCYPIEGYEVPYGRAQIVLINDSERTPETPANAEEFKEFVKKYKGQVTYAALPDFTGSAFVRNIIYEICGHEQFMNMEADKEVVAEAVAPAMEYLRSLNPYLWNEAKTFPASSTQVSNMFADGELVLDISYNPYYPAVQIENEVYSKTSRSFLFDNGTIGNTNYMAIAFNSPNKAGAMVVINEMITPYLQARQFDVRKNLPVVDYEKLNKEEKAYFDNVDIGEGTLTQDELLERRLPEMPAALVPIIEEIWQEEVPGK